MDLEGLLKKIISEHDGIKLRHLEQDVADLGRRAIIPLVDYLKSDSADWRTAAAIGIGGLARHGGMNGLEAAILNALDPPSQTLKDDSPAVRKAAVDALYSTIGGYYRYTKILDALNFRLRTLVCNIFKPLVLILDDGSIDVRLAAANVIFQLGGSKNKNVYGFTWGDDEGANRARKIFIECLDHDSAEVRVLAAEQLQYDEDENIKKKANEEIKGQLLQALEDGDKDIRVRAAIGLGFLKDKRAVEPLIQYLKGKREEDDTRRGVAIRSLGELGDARAVEPLTQILQTSNNEDVREAAEEALEKIKKT